MNTSLLAKISKRYTNYEPERVFLIRNEEPQQKDVKIPDSFVVDEGKSSKYLIFQCWQD